MTHQPSEPYTIGVDLGGQSLKLAVVDSAGKIRARLAREIDAQITPSDASRLIQETISRLLDEAVSNAWPISGAGVVMPGYMDRERTRLLFAANLPGLSGSALLADIRAGLGLPVVFDADCNAAAVGEHRFGGGRGVDRLIVATIGTGIGAGVIVDGDILRVRGHIAGSLGHVIVDADGQRCGCGARGCVETVASGRAIVREATGIARREPRSFLGRQLAEHKHLNGHLLAEALSERDEAAIGVVERAGRWLGVAVATWAVLYDPKRVLFGGGMAELGPMLIDAIRRGFCEVAQPELVERVRIDRGELGPDAGVIGAAALAAREVA